MFGKVPKRTVAKLPSNSFSVLARAFVPYSRLKIGNKGNTPPHRGKHSAAKEAAVKINLFRGDRGLSEKSPQFMVNPSLTDILHHDKMGHSRGFKGGIPRNIPDKVQHKKQNKITDTGRGD